MSFAVTDAFVQQFTGNVRMLAQQKYARFRAAVIEDQITGENAYLEQVAPTAARRVVQRHGDSPLMNTQHLRRRVAPYDYDWGDMVDRLDRARLLIDPASIYAMNAGYAMERAFDDEIIAAFFGTAYAGHAGATALTWPNGNSESTPTTAAGTQVAVNDWTYGNGSGNSGLTISKVISGRVALLAGEGDEDEEIYIAVTAKQIGNMLATTEFTSSDYAEVKALAQKSWNGMRALGLTWLHSERLLKNSSGQYRVPMWRKSGIGVGVARGVETRVAERPDKRFGVYVYADEAIGGARLEEVKVAELVCALHQAEIAGLPLGALTADDAMSVFERKVHGRIDALGGYHSPNLAYLDTPATAWSDIMTKLQGNQSGGVQSLPEVVLLGARVRQQVSTITLAAQASGTVIWVGRIPLGAVIRSIDVITDTSLGSTTIKFGDAHNGNSAIYGAAATLTATDTMTRFGPPTAQCGVQITTGYDYLGTLVTAGMPQTPSPSGGALMEDIIMTTGAATAPASGTLRVLITYALD